MNKVFLVVALGLAFISADAEEDANRAGKASNVILVYEYDFALLTTQSAKAIKAEVQRVRRHRSINLA